MDNKKRFVFKLNGIIYNEVAKNVTKDAIILFEGNPQNKIPATVQAQIDNQKRDYRLEREKAYQAAGLSFDVFVEAMIEDDATALAEFRNKRQKIKQEIPKPRG